MTAGLVPSDQHKQGALGKRNVDERSVRALSWPVFERKTSCESENVLVVNSDGSRRIWSMMARTTRMKKTPYLAEESDGVFKALNGAHVNLAAELLEFFRFGIQTALHRRLIAQPV